jgi:ketosteroid isomerase-like protein
VAARRAERDTAWAMSEENRPVDRREQVHAVMEAINARDFEALAEMPLDPQCEFLAEISTAEGGGAYVGIEGLRRWTQDIDATWVLSQNEVVEVREIDDEQLLVVFHTVGKARMSDVPMDIRTAQIWTVRHGLFWRVVAYADRAAAIRAAGLSG